jgi:hypothetical protein
VGFLWRIDNDDWERRTTHLLDMVMDALRPGDRVAVSWAGGP